MNAKAPPAKGKQGGRRLPDSGLNQSSNILSLGAFKISSKLLKTAAKNDIDMISYIDPMTCMVVVYARKITLSDGPADPREGLTYFRRNDPDIKVGSFLRVGANIHRVETVTMFMTNKDFYDFVNKDEVKEEEAVIETTPYITKRIERKVKINGQVLCVRDMFSENVLAELYKIPDGPESSVKKAILDLNKMVGITKADRHGLMVVHQSNKAYESSQAAFQAPPEMGGGAAQEAAEDN